MQPWRLVVIAIMVIFFRRIPALLALKPLIPDVKNWREALFAGHFGPIGVGAIFAALLTRAELETHSTSPLPINELPEAGEENFLVIQLIWPITCFLVISSILVHGSSIAVFTLGKRINTLTLTMSYTRAGEQTWMDRLPRIQSVSKSMSKSKADFDDTDTSEEKLQLPPGTLPPVGYPGNFLRRQKEDENPSRSNSRASSLSRPTRRKRWDSGMGPGGPISQSAIAPQRRTSVPDPNNEKIESPDESGDSPDGIELREKGDRKREEERRNPGEEPEIEVYEEGDQLIVEDEEGNVISQKDTNKMSGEERENYLEQQRLKLEKDTSGQFAKDKHHPHERNEGEEIEQTIAEHVAGGHGYKNLAKKFGNWDGWKRKDEPKPPPERKRGPAHAYQYGNTIIVEDEDGEVVKKYDLPVPDRRKSRADGSEIPERPMRQGIRRMTTWTGLGGKDAAAATANVEGESSGTGKKKAVEEDPDDEHIRFTLGGSKRRMSKADFIKQIQQLDPKAQVSVIEESDATDATKHKAKKEVGLKSPTKKTQATSSKAPSPNTEDSENENTSIPEHSLAETLGRYSVGQPETAAQRRRRMASRRDSDDDGTERIPPRGRRDDSGSRSPMMSPSSMLSPRSKAPPVNDGGETAAEKRRRLAALGHADEDSDSEDDGGEQQPKKGHVPVAEPETVTRTPGIRFAEAPAVSQGRSVQWGEGVRGAKKK